MIHYQGSYQATYIFALRHFLNHEKMSHLQILIQLNWRVIFRSKFFGTHYGQTQN